MERQLQGLCVPLGQMIMGCRAQLKRLCPHKHILIKCRSLYRGQAAWWHFDGASVPVCVCVWLETLSLLCVEIKHCDAQYIVCLTTAGTALPTAVLQRLWKVLPPLLAETLHCSH